MSKFSRFLVYFYLIFAILFLTDKSYSQSRDLHLPIRRGEDAFNGYYNFEKYYILSKISNRLTLTKINPDRTRQLVNYDTGNKIIYSNFFENNDVKIILVTKDSDYFYLKIFDEDFGLLYSNNIVNADSALTDIFWWNEQSKLLFFINEDGFLKIISVDLANNRLSVINTNTSIVNILKIKSSTHYLALTTNVNLISEIFIFNEFLDLIDQSLWQNLFWHDFSFAGNNLYLCGYGKDDYLKIVSYNFISRVVEEYDLSNNRFEGLLSCNYLSGDINDLFYLYNQGNNLELKSLLSNLNLSFDNSYNSDDSLKKVYYKDDELFDGFINYVFSSNRGLKINKINIHSEELILKNYPRSNFITVDNNVVFLRNNWLNRLIIFNDN